MAPGSPSTDSLFDYLYVDRVRLAAFSAQLQNEGVLQTTKLSDASGGSSSGQFTVGSPAFLGGQFSGGSQSTKNIERQFDAAWSLPLNVLDLLDESGYIRPDIESAQLGDIFLIEGGIRFLDYRCLKDCWEFLAPLTIAQQERKAGPIGLREKEDISNIFQIVQRLPHSIELMIHSENRSSVWTCPDPAGLTVSPETLTFTHGTSVPGKWFMIATLDALPETGRGEQASADETEKPMVKELQFALSQIATGLRELLGRPYGSYAATPLVIFRKTKPMSAGAE